VLVSGLPTLTSPPGTLLIFRWHWWIAGGLVVLPLLLGLMADFATGHYSKPDIAKNLTLQH
jgi:hypothetical protein